jgi:predicted esterase
LKKLIVIKTILLFAASFLLMFCANPETSSEESKTKEKKPVVEMEQAEAEKANEKQEIAKAHDTSDAPPKNLSPISTSPQNIELYVPAHLNINQPLPVVFIFDPHARGHISVELYRQTADEYGFVLAASNRSQNGQSIEQGLEIYDEMKKAVSAKVKIDASQIYTMGFSGGARVAVAAAIQNPEINAVIGCGAGFPEIMQIPQPNFNYFAIVGYEDFNMSELIQNDRTLRREGFNNMIAIFDGGHNWPPADIMEEAFLAIRLYNMKSGFINKNQQFISNAIDFYDQKIEYYTDQRRYFDAAETANRAKTLLTDLSFSNHFLNLENSFKSRPEYREDLSAMVKTLERESGNQNNYLKAFNEKSLDWWRGEIKMLKLQSGNVFEIRLSKRLLGFLGMVSYMFSNSAVFENNFDEAQKNIDIYRLLEPMNPEHAYLNAILKMKTGDQSLALEYLKQARFLGFNNENRMMNEPVFEPIRNHPDFLNLLK